MDLKICYAEMSFLRALVGAKQLDIWNREWKGILKKSASLKEATEAYNEIMNNKDLGKQPPVTETACCFILLEKFRKLEEKTQELLKRKK